MSGLYATFSSLSSAIRSFFRTYPTVLCSVLRSSGSLDTVELDRLHDGFDGGCVDITNNAHYFGATLEKPLAALKYFESTASVLFALLISSMPFASSRLKLEAIPETAPLEDAWPSRFSTFCATTHPLIQAKRIFIFFATTRRISPFLASSIPYSRPIASSA